MGFKLGLLIRVPTYIHHLLAPQVSSVSVPVEYYEKLTKQKMPPLPSNPLGIKIIAFSAAGLFADLVVVSLRLWARRLRKQRLGVGG